MLRDASVTGEAGGRALAPLGWRCQLMIEWITVG